MVSYHELKTLEDKYDYLLNDFCRGDQGRLNDILQAMYVRRDYMNVVQRCLLDVVFTP